MPVKPIKDPHWTDYEVAASLLRRSGEVWRAMARRDELTEQIEAGEPNPQVTDESDRVRDMQMARKRFTSARRMKRCGMAIMTGDNK